MEGGDYFRETDLLLSESMEDSMNRNSSNMRREGANGNVDGRHSAVSTDDELLDIRTGALEHWHDSDEEETSKNLNSSKIYPVLFCYLDEMISLTVRVVGPPSVGW